MAAELVPEITPARFDVGEVEAFSAHLREHGFAVIKDAVSEQVRGGAAAERSCHAPIIAHALASGCRARSTILPRLLNAPGRATTRA